ncbi:MAG: hypothetical protein GY771_15755, partial [bacterium]|nr:hypothetical protein [bacterium]
MRKIEVNLFLLIFLITVSKGFCGAWVIETVYDSEDIYGTSIALDSNDNPCIAFHILDSNDLMYAYFDGSVWQIDDVDISGGVGWHPSMELDDNDYPHISYYDSTNGDLKYAKWTGSSWEITRFDIGGYNGNRSSIALDSMGHPHISYHDETTKTLRYIWWNGTTWDRTTVDVLYGTGEPNSIAINSLDYPSISYRYRDYTNYTFTLKCARWNGTTWEITSIDTSDYAVAWYNSIDIDANDYEHIAYQTIYCLKYAKRTSSG